MLQLKNIVKTYATGDLTQKALDGVSIGFRKNEFVSILGPSGSGKTTLLNIIGGLDRYTSGDLVINGVSTKRYRDADWDYYRNNSIGFVFQSYNLIPHQSVLANVELALTLAGVSKKERRRRAVEVLGKVGLADHIHKRPNQMSGGQMQRVAIARALVNDPEILLADEPTGALDSETSVQIMELLKEIAKDKLVVMVTHNPELANRYSTRIVRLLDGRIAGDSAPFEADEQPPLPQKRKKISMSFFTALSLSFNNLRTKKGRTLLTAFAGSIGIIGIALILSLSTGIQAYINGIQRDTISSYPISIQRQDSAMTKLLSASRDIMEQEREERREGDEIYGNDRMYDLFNAAFTGDSAQNDLRSFKEYLDGEMDGQTGATGLYERVSTIQYQYDIDLNVYVEADGRYRSADLTQAFSSGSGSGDSSANAFISFGSMMSSRLGGMELWTELLSGPNGEPVSELLFDQYDVVAGRWPEEANELVLVLDKNNEISDVAFYALGMMDEDEVNDILRAVAKGEKIETAGRRASYNEVLGKRFRLVMSYEYYKKNADGTWEDVRGDEASEELLAENGYELEIVGIIRPNEDASAASIAGSFGYTAALTKYVIDQSAQSSIIREQQLPENENLDVVTGLPFVLTEEYELSDGEKAEKFREYAASISAVQKSSLYTDILSVPDSDYIETAVGSVLSQYSTRDAMIGLVAEAYKLDREDAARYVADYSDGELREMLQKQVEKLVEEKYAEQAQLKIAQLKAASSSPEDIFGAGEYAAVAAAFDEALAGITDDAVLADYYDRFMPDAVSGSTLSERLEELGAVDYDTPSAINIYAATFEDKEAIADIISDYNDSVGEERQISYTDYVALLMSGVTTMINAVSYALIGFVSISLVVSSIMIGIITYISVLERTKEIGILRSVGASKRDVSRVFNAETVIIGFAAGVIGIGITVLLNIPISIVAKSLTGISNIAQLPPVAGIILVAISVLLTAVAGLVPSGMAAKKDPVVALRTE